MSKTKTHLIFDEEKRREFLTGFHKRKLQRKKAAQEKFEKKLKEERKRLKREAKEAHKKFIRSYAPIPEVEELLKDEYENDEVKVEVEELSIDNFAERNSMIGTNRSCLLEKEEESDESQGSTNNDELISGMNSTSNKQKSVHNSKTETQPKSAAEIKKLLKKKATKRLQKSKTFQQKNRMERQKQKKKSMQKRKKDSKLKDNVTKKKNKF